MTSVHIRVAGPAEHLDEAATIWAEATAARDGDAEVAPLSVARPIIQRVIESSPRSLLLVAVDGSDQVVGFAAVAPMAAPASDQALRGPRLAPVRRPLTPPAQRPSRTALPA